MIKDKRVQLDFLKEGGHIHHGIDQSETYAKISKEVDEVKLMVLDLRANQAGVDLRRPRDGGDAVFQRRARPGQAQTIIPQYILSEVEAYLDVKLPKIKSKRDKVENDRVLLR
jgi:hypothetical protein